MLKKDRNDRPSHMQLINCRVCHKKIKLKNYKDHLVMLHPRENSSNLSSFTDQSIAGFFKKSTSSKRQRSEVFDTDEEEESLGKQSRPDDILEPLEIIEPLESVNIQEEETLELSQPPTAILSDEIRSGVEKESSGKTVGVSDDKLDTIISMLSDLMKATNETEIASSRSVEKDEIENNDELNFNGDFNRNLHGKFLSARTLKD